MSEVRLRNEELRNAKGGADPTLNEPRGSAMKQVECTADPKQDRATDRPCQNRIDYSLPEHLIIRRLYLNQIDSTGDDEVRKGDKAPNGQENSLEYTDGSAAEHGSVSPIVDDIALWRPRRCVRHKLELFIEVRGHQIQHESGNATFRRRHRPHEENARALIVRVFYPSASPSPRATGDKRANCMATSQLSQQIQSRKSSGASASIVHQ